MFKVVFLTGLRAGQVVPITKSLLAGRSPECTLEVPDPNVSRQHTRLLFDGSTVTAVDNGSSNGTYVNDTRITGPLRLNHDDIVRLGETRLRILMKSRRGEESNTASSIFGFKEEQEDLSQSILLSITDLPKKAQNAEVLAARLQAIMKVSKTLVHINRIDDVLQGILEALFEVFPQGDRGFLMLGNDSDKLDAKAMRQRGKGVTENLSVSKSICRTALEKRQAILFDDSKSSDFDQGKSIVSLRIRSAMVVPLMVNDEILGLLQVDTPDRSRAFTPDDLELAVAVSQQAAIALHGALLMVRMEEEAAFRRDLTRFVPQQMVDQVLRGQLDLALGGRTCHGTILFSDVRGFTRMSERLEPERVVALMNGYFSRMVPCIEQLGGGVDKFIGDGVMAVWGVPIDQGDSPTRSAQAALDMHNALIGFNSSQQQQGEPRLEMGIGVNTGTVVAGNIGSDNRASYTVVGDAVNTAQRLEASAGPGMSLLSRATWNELRGAGIGLLMPPLKVKNKSEPIACYSLRGMRIVSNEIVLHLPLKSGTSTVWLTRRLADKSFLLEHGHDCDVCTAPLITAMAEWPDVNLGVPVMESVLPGQQSDGQLVRSQVRLPDPSLGGLLDQQPLTCVLGWDVVFRG